MKFRRKITLSFLLYIVLCSVAFAQVVEIPDPNLRQAVKGALNLPAGAPITQMDMRQLTELNARDSQITILTGLEYATNLTFLQLLVNRIEDISPLANLTQLKVAHLDHNSIRHLSKISIYLA